MVNVIGLLVIAILSFRSIRFCRGQIFKLRNVSFILINCGSLGYLLTTVLMLVDYIWYELDNEVVLPFDLFIVFILLKVFLLFRFPLVDYFH